VTTPTHYRAGSLLYFWYRKRCRFAAFERKRVIGRIQPSISRIGDYGARSSSLHACW
jgi:hypothetical protein